MTKLWPDGVFLSRFWTSFVGAVALSMALGPPASAGGDEEPPASIEQTVPEPADYRLDDYRAPTPATVAGGTAVTTAELSALMASREVLLIDVLPQQKRPEGLPEGTLWLPKPRHNIPGSVWLPEVGRGALSPEVEAYFRDNLERLTAGDRDRPLAIYCLAQCWMSWNAAKRAIGYGYRQVYWYRDGTDGWTAAGLPTAVSEPVPMDGVSN